MDPILDLARHYGLKVIEDAAQAHGAQYKQQPVGSLADAACFSFYPGKNLGAYGDGGALVTNNQEIADRVRLLRNHGRKEKYTHLVEGYGERLDALQAAVLRVKLGHLSSWNASRQRHAQMYGDLLSTAPDLVTPYTLPSAQPVYHLYVVGSERRDELQRTLQEGGIETGIHYPIPLHLQPALKYLGYVEGDLPFAEQAARRVLSLPMYPELTSGQITTISECVSSI
jgi:dTDP-4-amino-4,6-dideoxygalactose transaminase